MRASLSEHLEAARAVRRLMRPALSSATDRTACISCSNRADHCLNLSFQEVIAYSLQEHMRMLF